METDALLQRIRFSLRIVRMTSASALKEIMRPFFTAFSGSGASTKQATRLPFTYAIFTESVPMSIPSIFAAILYTLI
jgi:hypothetical protein